jgi:hypothetical protein
VPEKSLYPKVECTNTLLYEGQCKKVGLVARRVPCLTAILLDILLKDSSLSAMSISALP